MHIAAGYSYLTKRDFRIEPQNPPLMKELQALPIFLIHKLPFDPTRNSGATETVTSSDAISFTNRRFPPITCFF
jgi:hypothetical protein